MEKESHINQCMKCGAMMEQVEKSAPYIGELRSIWFEWECPNKCIQDEDPDMEKFKDEKDQEEALTKGNS